MSGDNEAIQPVSGDVRRYVEGGYRPVGATPQQVITQSPDWDGMNRGIGMFLDLGNNYVKNRSRGSGKQDYTGQYQVEMEDWASNPEYHNTDGTPNSKGREAARRIRVKYAHYVSGAEIRATDQSVGSGYKESVDNALRESFIKQQASDYEAQNKAALDIVSRTHPEWSQLPLQQRVELGNKQIQRVNAAINLQNTIKTSNDPKVVNSAIDSIADYLIEDLSEETITRMRTVGVTTKDRQELIDLWASVGVQNFGWSPQEAQVNAIKIADGAMAHLREYQKDLIAQTEDEIKFTVNDAKLKLLDSDPKLLAYYAATNGQIPPDVLSNLIAGNVSFGSAYRTVENKDGTYSRQLIVTDKNIRNLGLNYGNEATASASLASVIPEIDEALRGGNSTPLLGLRNLPALGGIMQAKNKDEKFLQAKQQLANDFSIELANNARRYYKGGNEINEDISKQISDVINTASYLGYTNEECKDIVNNALLSLGMKPVKGAHTPEELDRSIKGTFGRLARGEVLGFKLFGEAPGSQQEEQSNDLGIDVTQYMSGNNQISEAPRNTEQTNIINDEKNQMSVYETEGYKNFRRQILGDIRRGDIPSDEGQRRLNDYVYNFRYEAEPVVAALEVAPATTNKAYYGKGNIDLNNRTVVPLEDGGFATELSFSINDNGKEVLLPSVVNGKVLSQEDAIKHYRETGENLGKFDTIGEANKYAEELHERQEKRYSKEFKNINEQNRVIGQKIKVNDLKNSETKALAKKIDGVSKDKPYTLSEQVLARLMFGEAGNGSPEEKINIATVAFNRMKKWGIKTVEEACLNGDQFNCFKPGDKNYSKVISEDPSRGNKQDRKSWEECLQLARGLLNGSIQPSNIKALYYHTKTTKPSRYINKVKASFRDRKHIFYDSDNDGARYSPYKNLI